MFYAADDDHVLGLVEQALFHTDHLVGNIPEPHDRKRGAATTVEKSRPA
jgi:hypothetical protein